MNPATSGRPPQPQTVGEMLEMARSFLVRKEVEEARLEADLLVAYSLGVDRLGLLLRLDQPVQPAEVDRARDLLVRRGRREPVAYITGRREFYSRSFSVSDAVLIPRHETELLVDIVRDLVGEAGWERPRILDVGTGSGCLAVTLSLEIPDAEIVAVDVSAKALDVARANAEQLGATVRLVEGDGLEAAGSEGPWHVIVSNPPYVDPALAGDLAPEVGEFEPHLALFAPPADTDRWARELLGRAWSWLVPGGALVVELGHDQAPRVRELARAAGVSHELRPDLAGIERALVARSTSASGSSESCGS